MKPLDRCTPVAAFGASVRIALGLLLALAFFIVAAVAWVFLHFVESESIRAQILARTVQHVDLARFASSPGRHRLRDVFGDHVSTLCILPAYATNDNVDGVGSAALRLALDSAPPSEDLSWRLLLVGPAGPRWFIQDAIAGASLTQEASCFDRLDTIDLVVTEPATRQGPSARQLTFARHAAAPPARP